MKSLNIKTSDDQTFNVDWEVARQSQTIRTMLDDLGIDEDADSEDTIPLPNEEVTGLFSKRLWNGVKRTEVNQTSNLMTMNQMY